MSEPDESAANGRFGPGLTVIALIGFAIASYLLLVRVLGEAPACGPVKGCETVATSEYATVAGIPVALFGVVFSAVLAGACLAWWRRADRRALYVAYGLGLAGILAVAYLTYLELFVIEAICVWCVSYAITIVAGWLVAGLAALFHIGLTEPASERTDPRPVPSGRVRARPTTSTLTGRQERRRRAGLPPPARGRPRK